MQKQADAAGKIDWVVSIDSTIARVHQHGATLARDTGGSTESEIRGSSRLTTALAGPAAADDQPSGRRWSRQAAGDGGHRRERERRTAMMTAVLEDIRVPRAGKGRPRTRRIGCSRTRGTRQRLAVPGCVNAGSRRRSPNEMTRSRTAVRSRGQADRLRRRAEGALQGPQRRERCFNRSSNGVGSRCAQTSSPAATA